METLVQTPDFVIGSFALPEKLQAQAEAARARDARQTLAISSTFTAELVQEPILFWLKLLDLPFKLQFAPYNQVFQELLNPDSLFSRNHDGVNVALIRLEDLDSSNQQGDQAASDERKTGHVQQTIDEFILAVRTAMKVTEAPLLVFLCPPSAQIGAGPANCRKCTESRKELSK